MKSGGVIENSLKITESAVVVNITRLLGGRNISKATKLRVKFQFGNSSEEICDLEQAKYRFIFGQGAIVVVEGEVVNSYEELVRLANQDAFKDKEFLDVYVLEAFVGGG